MKTRFTLWFLPVLIGWSQVTKAQNVYIPDANFKNYLLSTLTINTNADGEIQVSEAAAFSGTLNVGSAFISDLTGIEAFTALTGLNCSGNSLTGLDLSSNPNLKTLYCDYNFLTGLNILSNTMLTILSCHDNYLTNLNVANNTALISVTCSKNQLPGLFLDNNPALKYLNCQDNQITFLSLHAHLALREIRCHNNQLTTLNVKNGSNSSFTAFSANNNPNLTCITVDNVSWSNSNWSSGKDASAMFSFDCLNVGINEIDNEGGYSVYPNPSTGIFMIRSNNGEKQTANLYDVSGKLAFNKNIEGDTEINTGDLNDGIYTLIIRSENSIAAKKVVITH